jgi:hypothetical protein
MWMNWRWRSVCHRIFIEADRNSASIVRNRREVSDSAIYNHPFTSRVVILMRNAVAIACAVVSLSISLAAQNKRLWVLCEPGTVVEYDAATFSAKGTVKVPADAVASPQNFSINSAGQMLFAASVALPLSEEKYDTERKVWFWDGHAATTIPRDVSRVKATIGSNLAFTESAPTPFLAADGAHLYWFSNQARRLQRDGVDLSTKTTWLGWRTDLANANREDLASLPQPECSCPSGGCEETCPYGQPWVPDNGIGEFFLLTQFIAGESGATYKSTSLFQNAAGKWASTAVDPPFHRILDAPNPNAILEAIPDTGCCGWSNKSDDQTRLHLIGKTLTIFDERLSYKNPDYDVSFYTDNGKLSPDLSKAAFTIVATSSANKAIQLADDGQANPEESEHIRKALLELPAVEVRTAEDSPRRVAFLPHARLVGWLGDKEILVVEEHWLVVYNISNNARRRTGVRVEDAVHVFLR